MKRQRIEINKGGNTFINREVTQEWNPYTGVYETVHNYGYGFEDYRERHHRHQDRLVNLLNLHWPGMRRYRVNRLAFKLQRALKYLLFNIRHGLTKRLDWYGERLNALQTNETLGDL